VTGDCCIPYHFRKSYLSSNATCYVSRATNMRCVGASGLSGGTNWSTLRELSMVVSAQLVLFTEQSHGTSSGEPAVVIKGYAVHGL